MISADSIQLAPFYDLMSTVIYEGLSEKMAAQIEGQKFIAQHGGAKTIPKIISVIESTAKRFI